jgi:hypothetical protein
MLAEDVSPHRLGDHRRMPEAPQNVTVCPDAYLLALPNRLTRKEEMFAAYQRCSNEIQVHGISGESEVIVLKTLRRAQMLRFF